MSHFDFENGEILLIDKPYKWTSFDAVGFIRSKIKDVIGKRIKVGHAGTLDPLATGLLIICTGKATKLIEKFQDFEKEYTGNFTFGATTPCFDMEKPVDQVYPYSHISLKLLKEKAKLLTGVQQQLPPIFSAVKINGKRAYQYARENTEVVMQTKTINISAFDITSFNLPQAEFRIVCSKGTYIRAIARDLGVMLDSGAYLSSLCRTRIGENKLSDALSPEVFANIIKS